MYMPEPGKLEILKWVRAASAVSALCMSWEALRWSIDALHACLDMYDLEVWLILHEQNTCAASVKELEEVLAVEESTDDEAEMRKEKACYNAKRAVMGKENMGVETGMGVEEEEDMGKGEGGSESDKEEENEDEPMHLSGLSAKAKGKQPAK